MPNKSGLSATDSWEKTLLSVNATTLQQAIRKLDEAVCKVVAPILLSMLYMNLGLMLGM
jgi:hypothetical protein